MQFSYVHIWYLPCTMSSGYSRKVVMAVTKHGTKYLNFIKMVFLVTSAKKSLFEKNGIKVCNCYLKEKVYRGRIHNSTVIPIDILYSPVRYKIINTVCIK